MERETDPVVRIHIPDFLSVVRGTEVDGHHRELGFRYVDLAEYDRAGHVGCEVRREEGDEGEEHSGA